MALKIGNSSNPIYKKLYWELKRDILLGNIAPGSRMPTVEGIHKQYKVAQGTVLKALELLEREGLLTKRRGTGIYVAEPVDLPIWNPHVTKVSEEKYFDFRPVTYDLTEVARAWVKPAKRVVHAFEGQQHVLKDGCVYSVDVRFQLGETPRCREWTTYYYPVWYIESLKGKEAALIDPRAVSRTNSALKIKSVTTSFRPWVVGVGEEKILNLPEGTPIFFRIVQYFDALDRLLCYAENMTSNNILTRKMVIA